MEPPSKAATRRPRPERDGSTISVSGGQGRAVVFMRTAEDLVETAAQQGPVMAGDGEVATEVEQGLLADLA